ncbi:isochorismate synthase [Melittangium boletus]|uniref:isochorismate synthase n=1 Tax=Melittangium boletus DSM 14713 TaxID=1294270 RepID=A0A250INP0_9BACT|nr:isochorismate synthase [Melittangium boletus]ATB33365.1 menaquinone-specific isochorismate synthase [Melittangium boletus DSM 14713]
MTTLGSTDASRWVAGWRALVAADPLAGAEVLGEPSVYWERPLASEAVAGWGEAGMARAENASRAQEVLRRLSAPDAVRWLEAPPPGMPGPWFGGMRFGEEGGDEAWTPFGFGRWTLPEVMVWREGGGLAVAAFAPEAPGAEDAVRARLERVATFFPSSVREPRGAARALRMSSPRRDFEERVERALEAIHAERFHKVVLARAVEVEADEDFDRVDILARLREQNPRCATFFFRAPDGSAFLGATPETLCRLEASKLETEALAGSAAPLRSGELESSDKDRREHMAVVHYILRALKPLAEHVEADGEPGVLALKNVVHLRTGIRAGLREGIGVAELMAALHPTPAVGGTPRENALAFIATHEALDRGWYAGPVGWVGPGRAHQMVALRSARVKGARARLFVGAGIVAGSSAESEWRETEMKGLAMLRALGGGHV